MMDQKEINETLRRNVGVLSKHTVNEVRMMPTATQTQLPSVEDVKRIVSLIKSIIFTDYFHKRQPDEELRAYQIGVSMEELYRLLRQQIARGLQFCEDCQEEDVLCTGERLALEFIDSLPEIKRMLYTDIQAMFDNDPAAQTYGEVIFCYPVVNTMVHYRVAHRLHEMGVPVIPRVMSEIAHSKTGIDIHPGATIGERFFIDHGTGVVIGETCVIGKNVRLYQGVTLGGLSFDKDSSGALVKGLKRHPNIEDNVVIYANATILGGDTTIGHDSEIGGNVWLRESIPPNSRVYNRPPAPSIKAK